MHSRCPLFSSVSHDAHAVSRDAIRLPVLMFIHGESFQWNAGSSYDGSVLASAGNIVVVTINFRLGVLGESLASRLPDLRLPLSPALLVLS